MSLGRPEALEEPTCAHQTPRGSLHARSGRLVKFALLLLLYTPRVIHLPELKKVEGFLMTLSHQSLTPTTWPSNSPPWSCVHRQAALAALPPSLRPGGNATVR